ncbi:MAG: 6-hydroxymethylpterin diphosphokinase MptE-like protein, partial [Myxococcota bacterium]
MPHATTVTNTASNEKYVQLLPHNWDRKHDVLLIVGEGAGALAAPFVQAGLERVIAMYPPPLKAESCPKNSCMVQTRQDLTRTINLLGGQRPRQFATIRTPGCSLDKPTTDGIAALLTSLIQRGETNQVAQDVLAPLWAENSIRNMPRIAQHPMVTDVQDSFRGMPLVIVGAGPSLQKNIHLVAELQERAIILGVNRTLTSLQNAGVWPDLAMALEAQDVGCHFNGIQAEQISALILAVTASPNLYDLPFPNLLSYSGNLEADSWMFSEADGVHEIPSGGSVSCSALSLGLLWGCDPIILLGQDLSFPGGEYYHAHGADGNTRAVH